MKLKNVDDTHELKIAEALDTNIAVLTQNGSRDVLFTFLAQEPGKINIRMRVAHSKTLCY